MRKRKNKFIILNAFLGILVLVLLIGYFIQQNSIASRDFKTDLLAAKLKQAQDAYNKLIVEKALLDRVEKIHGYALEKGMVEAGEIIYVFESGKVALKKI